MIKTRQSKFRKANFKLESEGPFIGWTNGKKKGGWDCPKFEKEEADKVMKAFNFQYDEKTDAYIERVYDGDVLEYEESYKSSFIDTPDGKIKVYALGLEWVWEEI